jgi:hypothetical protein
MIIVVVNRLAGDCLPRHAILFTHPLVQVDELAAFRAKGPKGIILPFDLLVAGRTFHLETMRVNLVG